MRYFFGCSSRCFFLNNEAIFLKNAYIFNSHGGLVYNHPGTYKRMEQIGNQMKIVAIHQRDVNRHIAFANTNTKNSTATLPMNQCAAFSHR